MFEHIQPLICQGMSTVGIISIALILFQLILQKYTLTTNIPKFSFWNIDSFLSQTWIILFFLMFYWFYLMIVIFAHCLNWKTHLYIAITFLVQLAAFNKYNNFMFSTSFLGSRISMNLLAAFSDCTSVIFILTVCYRQYFVFQGY